MNFLSGFVETGATVVKMSVPVAKDFADGVADFAKYIHFVT